MFGLHSHDFTAKSWLGLATHFLGRDEIVRCLCMLESRVVQINV